MKNFFSLFRSWVAGRRPPGDFESLLEHTYSRILKPGDLAVDVGAHSGRHTIPMASLVKDSGSVLAFEPNPKAREILRENASRLIEIGVVTVFPHALSDVTELTSFVIADDRPEESGLRKRQYNGPTTTTEIEVEVTTLDSILNGVTREPTFIKIDVEGAEFSTLKGACNTLKESRPIVAFEFGEASYKAYEVEPGQVYDFFDDLKYKIYSILGHSLTKDTFVEASRVQAYWDYVACPEEKIDIAQRAMSKLNGSQR